MWFFKFSFDGNVKNDQEGATSVIRASRLDFLVAEGCHLLNMMVSMAKLREVRLGIVYARKILHLDQLIIESNSATTIIQIRKARRSLPLHLYIQDVALVLQGYIKIIVHYVYQEANSTVDWMASFVANHSSDILCIQMDDAPAPFL